MGSLNLNNSLNIKYPFFNISNYFTAIFRYIVNIILIIIPTALKFKVEPHDVIVPQGHSVLLPCDGFIHQSPHSRKNAKSPPPPTAVTIRWRGPDGQDIEIVDTFRAQFPNGSLYISSLEADRGLTGRYQCVMSAEGIGTIVSRLARVSIASE